MGGVSEGEGMGQKPENIQNIMIFKAFASNSLILGKPSITQKSLKIVLILVAGRLPPWPKALKI